MRVRVGTVMVLVGAMLAAGGCGGDNLELCDGCGTPVPTITVTPSPTITSTPATPVPSATARTPTPNPTGT
jgi:hypothetical protein